MRLQLALFLSLPALALARAAPWHTKRNTEQIYDGALVGGKTYDYVIAGGGLGGVVLAARLSEDSSKTVLVIEAGYSEEHNSVVTGECSAMHQSPFTADLRLRCISIPGCVWSKLHRGCRDPPTIMVLGSARHCTRRSDHLTRSDFTIGYSLETCQATRYSFSRQMTLTPFTDLARLAVPDRPADVGEWPDANGACGPRARRQHGHQWYGLEQAPQLPGESGEWLVVPAIRFADAQARRARDCRQRWRQLELAPALCEFERGQDVAAFADSSNRCSALRASTLRPHRSSPRASRTRAVATAPAVQSL